MLRLAFSLMLALPLFGYTQDYTKDDLFLDLDDLLQTKHTQYGLEGAAISVRLKDASVWTGTAGNRAPSDPIDPNLQWNLGSMQKSFVAIMIMQLIEEGSLQLDDAIGSYLNTDTLPNIDSAITVRSLLNHTSPLNDGWYENSPFENDVWADRSAIWNVEQTLPYAEAPEASPSGEHRYMPHINFALLGLLVESVTGNDLSLEIEERIFNPLGLNNAVLCASAYDMALLNGVYKGSQSRSTWNHNSYLTSRFAINIAIEDLVYVHHALHHGMLMDTNVAAMMRNETVPTTNAGPIPCGGQVEVDYGYGLLVPKMAFSEDDTMTTYGHSGTGINAGSVFHSLEHDWTVAIMTNEYDNNLINALVFDVLCHMHDNPISWPVDTTDTTTSVGRPIQVAGCTAFPNPASGSFTVRSEVKISRLQLVNFLGEVVWEHTPSASGWEELTVTYPSSLARGTYVLRVLNESTSHHLRIVLQ